MSDEELAELEEQLIAKLNQHTQLAEEATEIAERIIAERQQRCTAAAVR